MVEIKKEPDDEVDIDSETDYSDSDEGAGDKIKAGVKAVGKKIQDPDRDLETEYEKEKVKEAPLD
ncbi:MAG TPA: hypothetical protein VFT83_02685 [Nitrososphaeraceae archaeon]|nr:hypothetical protein [Nitrososphaeraceae archaeon]